MYQNLLALLPHDIGSIALTMAVLGSAAGCALWMAGARFSRAIFVLLAVTSGAVVGMELPAWRGWQIDGMGPAVGGALLLGVCAFLMHRFWVGVGLGLILACWASLAALVIRHVDLDWTWPVKQAGCDLPDYLNGLWTSLPVEISHIITASLLAGMLAGIALTAIWPRIALVVMWSCTGISVVVVTGSMMMRRLSPSALEHIHPRLSIQMIVLLAVAAMGAALQWRLFPAESHDPPAKITGKSKKPLADDE